MKAKYPNGHEVSDAALIDCQSTDPQTGRRCRRRARFCGYRAGPAFDYFCPVCWALPGPDGRTPKERAGAA